MNLTNLAEKEGASEIYLILDRLNPTKEHFRKMFRVIDAERVNTQ